MRTQSADTHYEAERVQVELLRKSSVTKRFALIESWSQFIREAVKQDIRREHPNTDEDEVALILFARQHGELLADRVRAFLERRQQQ